MKEVVVLVTLLVTLTVAQGQHHGHNRHNRERRQWPYNYDQDRYATNTLPRGPAANQGEPGLPGLPGLQGPPGEPGLCNCPEPSGGCSRDGAVHMFEFYHDMAGSNIGPGSMAFISNTNDMWLKTREGWKKIGWLK